LPHVATSPRCPLWPDKARTRVLDRLVLPADARNLSDCP